MEVVDFSKIAWPAQWTPIDDEYCALEFGRSMNSEVAGTIVGELQREMCQEHPLYGVACQPIAYDARIKKDFLFQTEQQEARFVLVHFTWQKERRPNWPIMIPFQSLQEFLQYERKYQHEAWLSRIFKRIRSWASRRSHKAW